ncbi:MAG TPA: hypothetical protein VFS43_00190 [Polyangiaceae bacterium]|nr:hypothetical protein [Polyangiaceae bacterium]
MGRRPKEDRDLVKTVTVGVKLTVAEREALDRLVEVRSAELARLTGERIEATASGVLRWLMLEAAAARGIPTGAGEARPTGAPARPRATAKAPKGKPAKGRKRAGGAGRP